MVANEMKNFKKEVKKKIAQYSNREYLDGYIKKEFLTDDGDADITLRVKDKYDLFDYRTSGNQMGLNNDIYEFIDDKTSMLDNDVGINLHIEGLNLSEKEEGRVKHIIKEHYAIELYKNQKEYRYEKNKSMTMILFGLILLLLYGLIYIYFDSEFLLEVFGFMFSFSLWVAFENIIYTVSELKDESQNIAQKLLMNVEFKKSDK